MEEKKDHRKAGFPGFIRYRENNLTGKEKNEFERELLKDPFAAEAGEGFSNLPAGELGKDMEILSGRLKKRTATGSRKTIYRIAAAVVLLLTLSAIYLLLNRSPVEPAVNRTGQIAMNTPKAQEKTETVKNPSGAAEKVRKKVDHNVNADKDKTLPIVKEENTKQEINAVRENLKTAQKAEEVAAAPLARSVSFQNSTRIVSGNITAADGRSPIPGAFVTVKGTTTGTVTDSSGNYILTVPEKGGLSIVASYPGMEQKEVLLKGDSVMNVTLSPTTQALSEVVVAGYSARKAAGAGRNEKISADEAEAGYTQPEPVKGNSAFNDYIRDNIRRPEELKPGEKAVVVLSFTIRVNGTIDSIKTVRSPGKPFTDEATRLLIEGPAWKPATENGKPVEIVVRLRIVFR